MSAARAAAAAPVDAARAYVVLAAGVAVIGTAAVLIRLCDAPAASVAFWRMAFALLLLAPLWWRWRQPARLPAGAAWRLAASGACLGVHFAAWIASLDWTSVAASVLIVTTNPLWVGLLSPWVTGERPGRAGWSAIAVAMVGAALVGFDATPTAGARDPLRGNLLALVGAWGASGYLLLGRRVRPTVDFWTYSVATVGVAVLVLAGALAVAGGPWAGFAERDWTLMLALAVGPQLCGHGALMWSLRHVGAEVVAVFLLAETLVAAGLAWWLLGEVPGAAVLAGAPLLLGGVAVLVRRQAAAAA